VPISYLPQPANVDGLTAFLRVDANVPIENGEISDDGRIRSFIPTLEALTERGCRVLIGSHLGRPDLGWDSNLSIASVAERTENICGKNIPVISAVSGDLVKTQIEKMRPGEAAFLENLRFDKREASSNPKDRISLAEEWARDVDLTVSDGFGVVHRKQASVFELPKITKSYAGEVIRAELAVLEQLSGGMNRPYTLVLGGSKVSDKLGIISRLIPKVDTIAIGGGMAFTFLVAMGYKVGKSIVEKSQVKNVNRILAQAEDFGVELVLPTDIVMAEGFFEEATFVTLPIDSLEAGPHGKDAVGLDLGEQSAEMIGTKIRDSSTVFWNGPMGVFEYPSFASATRIVAEALAHLEGLSVVGGGDSASAVRSFGYSESDFSHISTGGGASLEFLEGKSLPGLEVLGWKANEPH